MVNTGIESKAATGVTVKVVETDQDLKDFIGFPYSLYRNNPYYVPPQGRSGNGIAGESKPSF